MKHRGGPEYPRKRVIRRFRARTSSSGDRDRWPLPPLLGHLRTGRAPTGCHENPRTRRTATASMDQPRRRAIGLDGFAEKNARSDREERDEHPRARVERIAPVAVADHGPGITKYKETT